MNKNNDIDFDMFWAIISKKKFLENYEDKNKIAILFLLILTDCWF